MELRRLEKEVPSPCDLAIRRIDRATKVDERKGVQETKDGSD